MASISNSTLSSPGIGSGLDVNSIVTQLTAIEHQPIDLLAQKQSVIQTKLSSFGLLSSYMSNVRDIAAQLAKPATWTKNTATSSDSSVQVSAKSTAATGTYSVSVTQLAQSQSLASKAFTNSTAPVGTGTLHIAFGSWNTGATVFTADGTRSGIDIAIGAGDNTLTGIKNKINATNTGVTASIVNDANGARLVVTSKATGAANAVRITATDDDGANNDELGLSALAFDPPNFAPSDPLNPGVQMAQTQAAADATATINGLAVRSANNTIAGAIDGVTLTLSAKTTSPVTVGVSLDTGSLASAVTSFAKAFSDISAYISSQTKYDTSTKTASPLQGDSATLSVQRALRNVFVSTSGESSTYKYLSDVGIEFQDDGTVDVDGAKLNAALAANPQEVAKLFSGTTSGNAAQQGFAVRVSSVAKQMLDTTGSITTHSKSLQADIARNQKQQDALQQRVDDFKARILKQYSALDTIMAQTSASNSALTQALTALSNQNTAIAKG